MKIVKMVICNDKGEWFELVDSGCEGIESCKQCCFKELVDGQCLCPDIKDTLICRQHTGTWDDRKKWIKLT